MTMMHYAATSTTTNCSNNLLFKPVRILLRSNGLSRTTTTTRRFRSSGRPTCNGSRNNSRIKFDDGQSSAFEFLPSRITDGTGCHFSPYSPSWKNHHNHYESNLNLNLNLSIRSFSSSQSPDNTNADDTTAKSEKLKEDDSNSDSSNATNTLEKDDESNSKLNQSSSPSTSESTTDTSNSTTPTPTPSDTDLPPLNLSKRNRLLFPWRSSSKTLQRILLSDDLSGFENSARRKFANYIAVGLQLKVPWWDILFVRGWERELATNCTMAFRMAAVGLLGRRFGVEVWEVGNSEDGGIRFETVTGGKDGSDNSDDTDTDTDNDDKEEVNETLRREDVEGSTDEYVRNMIDTNLLRHYSPLPTTTTTATEKYSFKFHLKPIRSQIKSTLFIPFLVRSDVNSDPSLEGKYTELEKTTREPNALQYQREAFEEFRRKTGHGATSNTLIVDLVVDCRETFEVRDLESGELVRGAGLNEDGGDDDDDDDGEVVEEVDDEEDDGEKLVSHVVRFEVETYKDEETNLREVGSWKIIDIDDMLNGNKWH